MKISALEASAHDTCLHHTSFFCSFAIERVIIILLPSHLSTHQK